MSALVLLTGLLCGAGALLALASRRWPANQAALVDAIDALLPQTQCAQCGYPGCRPYAEAVAGGAPVNLCPPGGASVHAALTELLGAPASPAPAADPAQVARIDEARCIGCFLCVQACPVDAIVGAPRYAHTVLDAQCTGCELCVEPCPVDCIDLIAVAPAPEPPARHRRRWPERDEQACIRCGACHDACPVGLHPQQMLWFGERAADALERCIECGLCNPVCPSNIDLAGRFQRERASLAAERTAERLAEHARARYEQRRARLAAQENDRASRRRQRLAQPRSWT